MPEISKLALDTLYAQLSDAGTGFNAKLAAIASDYGITAYTVNWDKLQSPNFMVGDVEPDLIEESSAFTYPYTTIDTVRIDDTARVVSAVFAGLIYMVVNVHITTKAEDFPRAMSPLATAIEDAMFQTLNDLDTIGAWLSAGLTYGGRWSLQKSKIRMAGENWRQSLSFLNSVGLAVNI